MKEVWLFLIWAPALIVIGQYIFYNWTVALAHILLKGKKKSTEDFQPEVTVLIPTFNEESHIEQKLLNILQSDYPRDKYSLMVVDDGSEDRTREVVRRFESQGVRLIESEKRQGKLRALKKAFAEVKTPIVISTDATVSMDEHAMAKLLRHFKDPKVGAVTGRVVVSNKKNYLTNVQQFLFEVQNLQKQGESLLESTSGLFGQLFAMRLEALGNFVPDALYEDREFGISIRKRGYKAIFESEAIAYYWAPSNFKDFMRQKRRNIFAITQSVFRHSQLLFKPSYGWYGLLIFPEYSLFRLLRSYLLIFSFGCMGVYSLLYEPHEALSTSLTVAVVLILGFLLAILSLLPFTKAKGDFLIQALFSIPILVFLSVALLIYSLGYSKGIASPLWKKVKREET